MNDKNVIVGLDIGTTKVCTVVGLQTGKSKEKDIEIIGVEPSKPWFKKGSVVNIDKTIKSIKSFGRSTSHVWGQHKQSYYWYSW